MKGRSGGHQAGLSIWSRLGLSDRFISHLSTNLKEKQKKLVLVPDYRFW